MTQTELEQISIAIADLMDGEIRPILGRIGALEKRIGDLEQRSAGTLLDAYRGVYRAGDEYRRGEVATDDGSLWFCREDTAERPGSGAHWILAVKRGKDGRDAR